MLFKKKEKIIPKKDITINKEIINESIIKDNNSKKVKKKEESKVPLQEKIKKEDILIEKMENINSLDNHKVLLETKNETNNKIIEEIEKNVENKNDKDIKKLKKKKELDTKKVKDFHDVVKAINIYISEKDWEKAYKAIEEIRKKEKKSLNILINGIENNNKKLDLKKRFEKNTLIINKLEEKIKKEEKKYNTKISGENFILKIKNIIPFFSKIHKQQDSTSLTSKIPSNYNKDNYNNIVTNNEAPLQQNNIVINNENIIKVEKNEQELILPISELKPINDINNEGIEEIKKEELKDNTQDSLINKELLLKEEEKKQVEIIKEGVIGKISISQMKKNDEIQEKNETEEQNKIIEEQKIEDEKIEEERKNVLMEEKEENDKIGNDKNKKNLKKKKELDTKKVKDFHDAINAIDIYIFTEDWEKAHKAIDEIRQKEEEALNIFVRAIEDSNKKREEKRRFEKNAFIISKLEVKLKEKEQKYNDKISGERFKLKFKKIKEEITLLSKTHRNQEALNLLSNFLEDNKDKYVVIQFYNKEKRSIQRAIEKDRIREEVNAKKNTKNEALKLIGQTMNLEEGQEQIEGGENKEGQENKFKKIFNFYKIILEKKRKRKLIDEVTSLIESQNQAEMDIAKSKLEKVHQGLIKELMVNNIRGYEFFGKILGADKISGDTFGFLDDKTKYNFFLGDATGHGVKAGLIVSLLNRLFNKYSVGNPLRKIVFNINNGLKQDLQSRNFITGIFFEIEKEHPQIIQYVGMGHEPMFIYKSKEKRVEKLIPGGLASGIRIIKEEDDVRIKDIELENEDMLICFSDGIVEARNMSSELYGFEKLEICIQKNGEGSNITKLYNAIIDDVKSFKGGAKFEDDATVIILKRNELKDIIQEKDNYLQEVASREGLSNKTVKKMIGKTKEQLEAEIEKIKKEKQLLNIIKVLEGYYYTGEILMLKQEAIRFIKEGFIHPKINKYLKLAIANETKYKVEQKNKKIESKYNVLKELMKKGDYMTVIKECNEIIAKDGNI
ncbi:SpoIIE family protein phosphatase [Candidatus Gracilibacteria bacterium]|nr:SpoIIE family protein phosphatase [Candidatus Gracilibacteria bacterium]NUJ98372.1 SpoIIE family protein phosphatase [Candidatus Gracilibacteria bacterium]